MDDNKVRRVIILGGGDVGLLTALSLERLNPELTIEVIDDFDEEIPDVGKSTYQKMMTILHDFLGIDEARFIREVKPVWKGSVYFRNWCKRPEFHFTFDEIQRYPASNTPNSIIPYYFQYDRVYENDDYLTVGGQIVNQRKSPFYYDSTEGAYSRYPNVAYHLDLDRFNQFLRDVCMERGVTLVNDSIREVDTTNGRIKRLHGTDSEYAADLYVDASGFSRVIFSELNPDFDAFRIPLDAAVKTSFDRPVSEIIPATVIDSGEFGWFWNIDTYDYRDVGYVYSSNHVSSKQAIEEFKEHLGREIPEAELKEYEFESGYFREGWIGNCVAIGNSGGFVEPIQSTGLTANATAGETLASLLASHACVNDKYVRDTYNKWFRGMWNSIYDLVSLHYIYANGDNSFWDDMNKIDTSERIERMIEVFNQNGLYIQTNPIDIDDDVGSLFVFRLADYFSLMRSLGATSDFYESLDVKISRDVEDRFADYYGSKKATVEEYFSIEEVYEDIVNRSAPAPGDV